MIFYAKQHERMETQLKFWQLAFALPFMKLFKSEYIQIAYDHLDTFYDKSKLFAGL